MLKYPGSRIPEGWIYLKDVAEYEEGDCDSIKLRDKLYENRCEIEMCV